MLTDTVVPAGRTPAAVLQTLIWATYNVCTGPLTIEVVGPTVWPSLEVPNFCWSLTWPMGLRSEATHGRDLISRRVTG